MGESSWGLGEMSRYCGGVLSLSFDILYCRVTACPGGLGGMGGPPGREHSGQIAGREDTGQERTGLPAAHDTILTDFEGQRLTVFRSCC